MGKKLFNFVIGNPPYQKESSGSESKTNGQKPMTNIFQYFQEAADAITKDTSVLVYPGGRWIHQSGKGMQSFGKDQINDKSLSVVEFYPDASELLAMPQVCLMVLLLSQKTIIKLLTVLLISILRRGIN